MGASTGSRMTLNWGTPPVKVPSVVERDVEYSNVMAEQPPSGVTTSAIQNSSRKSGVVSERSNPDAVPPAENAKTRPSGSRPTR